MTDITIPPAALRAARAASMNALGDGDDSVNAACLAMLRNWPGMGTVATEDHAGVWRQIILPLPQESGE